MLLTKFNRDTKYSFYILTTGLLLFLGSNQANAALSARGSENINSFSLVFDLPAQKDTWNSTQNTYVDSQNNNQKLQFWSLILDLFDGDVVDGLIQTQHLVDPHTNKPPPGVLLLITFRLTDPPQKPPAPLRNTISFKKDHKDSQGKHSDGWILTLDKTAQTLKVQGSHCSEPEPKKSLSVLSTLEENTGEFCISEPVPEPSSLLSLLSLGILGTTLTFKRKQKTSKSSEKGTTKVG